jgi:glycosyltransferase involved in cell wall biosynthesis
MMTQDARGLKPFVSVIVPVSNDSESIGNLLLSLEVQEYPRERFECIIVDNASEGPLRLPAQGPLQVRVVREERPGSYAARNLGLREARGEVLAFTDADCVPRPDWLSSAVTRVLEGPRPIMIGGPVEVTPAHGAGGTAFDWYSIINDFDQARFLSVYRFAATANLVATRDAFERVGHFNATLMSGGDYEWGRRAWSMGIEQVYAPEVIVRHPARATWAQLAGRHRRIIGGHEAMRGHDGRGRIEVLLLILRLTWAAARRSWRDPRLPNAAVRLHVMAIDAALRILQVCEVVRLWMGGQPCRS